jgi:hypothetical protein
MLAVGTGVALHTRSIAKSLVSPGIFEELGSGWYCMLLQLQGPHQP